MKLLKNRRYVDRVLETVYVPTSSVTPNKYNPNVHDQTSFDLLVTSLNYFGFTQPVVVREETREIIDGENRWRAAAVLGLPEIPVCMVSLTDEEMMLATILHNRARGRELPDEIRRIYERLGERSPELRDALLLLDRPT